MLPGELIGVLTSVTKVLRSHPPIHRFCVIFELTGWYCILSVMFFFLRLRNSNLFSLRSYICM